MGDGGGITRSTFSYSGSGELDDLDSMTISRSSKSTSGENSTSSFTSDQFLGQSLSSYADQARMRPTGPNSNSGQSTASGQVSGAFNTSGVKGSGQAGYEAGASSYTETTSSAGLSGASARAAFGASAGVSADASGTLEATFGSITGHVGVSASVFVTGEAYVTANFGGAEAGASVAAGAVAQANAQAHALVGGGLATADGEAHAESGAGAAARAVVTAGYRPLEAALNASAGAFAGARAGFTAHAGSAGLGAGISGEAWAGAGVKAEIHAGLKDGKYHFEIGLGIAIGVGCFLKVQFDIDLKPLEAFLGDVVGFAGGILEGIAGLFGAKKGDGSLLSGIISTAMNVLNGLLSGQDSNEALTALAAPQTSTEPVDMAQPPSDATEATA